MIERLYEEARRRPSDICEHLELLSRLSSLCDGVTEFGVRTGVSTVALIHGRPKRLVSYDVNPVENLSDLAAAADEAGVSFTFHQVNVLRTTIEETGFLFIDTLHTFLN